jgi:hypothetical protein
MWRHDASSNSTGFNEDNSQEVVFSDLDNQVRYLMVSVMVSVIAMSHMADV